MTIKDLIIAIGDLNLLWILAAMAAYIVVLIVATEISLAVAVARLKPPRPAPDKPSSTPGDDNYRSPAGYRGGVKVDDL